MGVSGDYEHANPNFAPNSIVSSLRPNPPFAAIDKFLLGHSKNQNKSSINQFACQNNYQNPLNMYTAVPTTENGGCFLPSSTSSDNFYVDFGGIFSLPCMQEMINFADGLIDHVDGETSEDAALQNNGNTPIVSNNTKSKKRKRRDSTAVIKGQWTVQEDMALRELVDRIGAKQWSVIARHLAGRAGKQCRERWFNHLHPDIKKSPWSEEEERLLVEAHMQHGNKWAEIARQIPGRTENAIKNHWNATKRRLNTRKKNKRVSSDGDTNSPSVLQLYIQSLTQTNNCEKMNPACSPSSDSTTLSCEISGGPLCEVDCDNNQQKTSNECLESCQSVMTDPCVEEFSSMKNIQENNLNSSYDTCDDMGEIMYSTRNSLSSGVVKHQHFFTSDGQQQIMQSEDHPMMIFGTTNAGVQAYGTSHLPSDLLAYSLIYGTQQVAPGDQPFDNDIMGADQGFAYTSMRKDMDLIEMLSFSNCSQDSCTSADY